MNAIATWNPGKAPMIQNMLPGLVEIGKIKIGKKGKLIRDSFRQPEKLDHFIITTMQRDNEDNYCLNTGLMNRLMDKEGEHIEKLTEIPIRLLFNDISLNFQSRYACFFGKTRWCSGDGTAAMRLNQQKKYEQVMCPCERMLPDYPGDDGKGKGKCKMTGCLSCLIDGAQSIGGVWKFRTTGYNSVTGITSSLLLIHRISGGQLCGLPLVMKLNAKTTVEPLTGSTVKVFVVHIEYRAKDGVDAIEQLQAAGEKIALGNASHQLRIENIEEQARRLIASSVDVAVLGDDEEEHADEFHPEDAAGNAPIITEQPVQIAAPTTPATAHTAVTAATPQTTVPEPAKKTRKKAEPAATAPAAEAPKEPAPVNIPAPEGLESTSFFDMD